MSVNRAVVQAHPQVEPGGLFRSTSDFQRAPYWRHWIVEEHQCHSIAGRQRSKIAVQSRCSELLSAPHNILEFCNELILPVHRLERVAHHVDKKNRGHFKGLPTAL